MWQLSMLRIVEQAHASAAKSYYTEGLSRSDYYIDGQEIPGRWMGLAARRLGLNGVVEKAPFFALCDNLHPATGDRLTPRTKSARRVGYDLNFNAPKSVSLVYSLTGDERILDAFRAAVEKTMQDLEREVQTRVRRSGAKESRTAGNLVWAEFVHRTSRPVDGLPDPHLHAHCFVFNACWDGKENRFKAIDLGDIKRDAPYFEAAFHARLARGLNQLGYGISRGKQAFEISGVPRGIIDRFSRRTATIEATAKAKGITDSTVKAGLGATTRAGKDRSLCMGELREAWLARLNPEERAGLFGLDRPREVDAPNITAGQALDYALKHFLERASVVRERELSATAMRYGLGHVIPEELPAAFARPDLIRRQVDGQATATTKAVLAEERSMLEFVRQGRGACRPLHANPASLPDPGLSAEQKQTLMTVLQSPDRVIVVRGRAGTGKTTLMRHVVAGISDGGREVYAFAPTAEASRGVLRQEGFAADTVAALLHSPAKQEALQGQVLWIDEAGLMGSRELQATLHLARERNCRVILTGDSGQHRAVPRGDALRLLESEAGIVPAELHDIRRQRGLYKEAVQALSRRDTGRGLDLLDRMGAMTESPDADRYGALAEAYLHEIRCGRSVLAIAPTHAEGKLVTDAIRLSLKRDGRLGGLERPLPCYQNLQWTEAQRGDGRNYAPGLMVQFHQNAKGFKAGQRYQVTQVEDTGRVYARSADGNEGLLPLAQAGRFQVFQPGEAPLAIGDRVRVTQNGYTADRANRLNNGAVFEVKAISDRGDVRFENGWVMSRDYGHWTHGFCSTSHAAQGKTVDTTLIGQSSASWAAGSREQIYVSASRARHGIRIFTDDKQALRDAVSRSGDRLSATELLKHGQVACFALEQSRWQRLKNQALAVAQKAQRARAMLSRVAQGFVSRYAKERRRGHEPALG